MAYLGTPIDTTNQFQSLQGKRFNGDNSTTDFTLDVAPGSTLDIEVFVGNVRQDPNSAYTVSGTTLSFTGAPPTGTNNIYVVHQAKAVSTITPATNTVTNDMLVGSIANSKLANSSITLNGSAVSLGGSATVDNTPMWVATMSADQTGGNNSMVKINYNTEVLDTDSAYDTSTYRFTVPSGKAGKYFISAMTNIHGSGSNGARSQTNSIYVNGGSIVRGQFFLTNSSGLFERDQDNIAHCTLLHDLSVGDYVEVYAKRYSDFSENMVAKTTWSRFMGFKLA